MEQWEYEVTSGGRVRYVIDDDNRTVWLIYEHGCCHDMCVRAEIRISGGDKETELAALSGWLHGERELDGAVSVQRAVPGERDLGAALDVISVAVGSGGIGVALAQSLTAWLRSRRPDVRLTVSTEDGRSVEVEASNVTDPLPLLLEVVRHTPGRKA